MIVSEEYYIEHAGVKGMKWGIRKKKQQIKNAVSKPRLSDDQKRKLKRAAIGAGVLTAGLGAAFVGYKMKQAGISLSDVKDSVDMGREMVNQQRRDMERTQMKDISRRAKKLKQDQSPEMVRARRDTLRWEP
jgi:hypothetical protein